MASGQIARGHRAWRWAAVLLAILPALPGHARTRHNEAWARDHFASAERMREALNGRPIVDRSRGDYQKVLNAITTCIIKSIKQNHQTAISRQSHLEKAPNPHANFSLVPKAHWLVPFGRNKNFIGRHSQLEEVFARLDPEVSDDDCQRVAIAGLGGVGKTQIALEAAF